MCDILNKAVPNKPLYIQYAYNSAWLNTPAIKFFGLGTKKFNVLPGTVLEKDKNGNFIGIVDGYTFQFHLMGGMLPQSNLEEEVSLFSYLINDLNRFGLTTVIDNSSLIGYPEGHRSLQMLIKDNKLNIRFPFADLGFSYDPNKIWADTEIERITKISPLSPGQNLHPDMEHGYEYEGTGEVLRAEGHDHENFDRPTMVTNENFWRISL
ncbi:hypothetical protein GCM10023313_17840 [Mucilaginibacter defluvii]|uniref:Amidohydrolase 3 domain-containing protein n=1 Tax=Mucilaginibacter defluvii TaxID=1196019 RepID=A0ABP9FS19_9SPHI